MSDLVRDLVDNAGPDDAAPDNTADAAPQDVSIRDLLNAAVTDAPEGDPAAPDPATPDDGNGNGDGRQSPGDDAGQAPAAPPAIEPPASMTPAEREAFAKLPHEAQAFMAQRERQRDAHFTQVTQEVAAERKFYGELRQPMEGVARFAQHFQAHPAQVLGAWSAVQDHLLRDPKGAIAAIAKDFGVDLQDLALNAPPIPAAPDPALQAMAQRIGGVEQFMQMQRQQMAQAEQRRQQQAQAEIAGSIQAFRSAKGSDGQPLRPHFDRLSDRMAALVSSGHAASIEDAYDQALWADPQLRAAEIARAQATAQAQAAGQAAAQARQQTRRARMAGGSIAGAPGGVAPAAAPSDTSIGGLLRAAAFGG